MYLRLVPEQGIQDGTLCKIQCFSTWGIFKNVIKIDLNGNWKYAFPQSSSLFQEKLKTSKKARQKLLKNIPGKLEMGNEL